MVVVRVAVVVVSVVMMLVVVVGVIATPGQMRLSGAAAASRVLTVLMLTPHTTAVLCCSIHALRSDVFSHVGKGASSSSIPKHRLAYRIEWLSLAALLDDGTASARRGLVASTKIQYKRHVPISQYPTTALQLLTTQSNSTAVFPVLEHEYLAFRVLPRSPFSRTVGGLCRLWIEVPA
jgi:hypothetical protein